MKNSIKLTLLEDANIIGQNGISFFLCIHAASLDIPFSGNPYFSERKDIGDEQLPFQH